MPVPVRDRLKSVRDREELASLPAAIDFLVDRYESPLDMIVEETIPEDEEVPYEYVLGEAVVLDPKPFDPACPEGYLYAVECGERSIVGHKTFGPLLFSNRDAVQAATKKHPNWGAMHVKASEAGIAELADYKTSALTKKPPNAAWLSEYRETVPVLT